MDLITYALLKRQIAECETNIKAFIPHIGENENWYVGDEDTGKPSRGDKGPDGKSAYQYAQDGGYTGTEEEFTAKLAAENIDKALFVVNITQNSDRTFSADKTFEEIVQTYNEGKHNIVANAALKFPRIAPLAAISEHAILFSNSLPNGKNDAGLIAIVITSNNEVQIEMLPLATKTSKLPNPNALTFTGAVTGSYDGSAPLSVEIPSGGGGTGGETFTGQWEELVNHTVTADEATSVKLTFTQANYPKINCQKTLLVEIVKPSSVTTPWFVVSAGNTEVVNVEASPWLCCRAVAAVRNGHWLQMSIMSTNAKRIDTIAPGYVFNAKTLGNRNKVYANYTSLTIRSYENFLEEGTTIKIYGGK